jgi:hypothetical protein
VSTPTGRQPGRPPNLERRVRLAALDAAPAALDVLTRAVELGDVHAAEAVLRLALDLPPARPAAAGG